MSRLTFISNADVHLAASGATIVSAAAGVSGIWDLNGNAWQTAAALTAADTIQVVQGKGSGEYPLFSQIFNMKGVKMVYTPYVRAVKQSLALTVAATGAVGSIHSLKLVRRATDIGYDKYMNPAAEDFGRTDQVTPIEYVTVTGDTTSTIAAALAAAANKIGKKYGFVASSNSAVCTIVAAEFGHEFDMLNFAGSTTNTLAVTAKVEGSGNYHQVISAEKETQAMQGYHGRAGSFLNTPDTFTSKAIAPVATSATLGYDAITLHVPTSTSGNVANDASAMSNITLYFDGVDANMANYETVFGITAGTASTITL
jgi:hypothetical protein